MKRKDETIDGEKVVCVFRRRPRAGISRQLGSLRESQIDCWLLPIVSFLLIWLVYRARSFTVSIRFVFESPVSNDRTFVS